MPKEAVLLIFNKIRFSICTTYMGELLQQFEISGTQRMLTEALGGVSAVELNERGEAVYPGSITATYVARLLPKNWNELTGPRFCFSIEQALAERGQTMEDLLKAGVLSRATVEKYWQMEDGRISTLALRRVSEFLGFTYPTEIRRYFQEALWRGTWDYYEKNTDPKEKELYAAIDGSWLGQPRKQKEVLERALSDPDYRESLIRGYHKYIDKISRSKAETEGLDTGEDPFEGINEEDEEEGGTTQDWWCNDDEDPAEPLDD